ncbi:uncharacterized protein LOC121370807 [Gigantopelta aegis]|uniref:uncharacterized protein LOC121370807 n=1 Tax=Gigantopelta aegis TaxID=1735272 RepID=UPI001B88CB75|nr:uncharacterized protein LOC121370807 [Gigantopelta aegis]
MSDMPVAQSPCPGSPVPVGSLADKLRLAASKGQLEKIQELLEAGASFEPDRDGRTCLHYAAQNGYAEVCKYLAQKCSDTDAQDVIGFTALHRAASQGHAEVIEILALEGCSMDIQDQHGNTAVHESAWNGYSRSLQMLIKHNASVFIPNKTGFTALHLASQNGHNESLRVLLYASCNTDLKNNYGDTAVHTAARYGHAGVTRILLSAKCNLNEQNKNGDTALHIASALKRRKIAKLLVEGAIDVSIKNKQNESAIDVARRKEHPEIILIVTSFSRPRSSSRRDRTNPKTHHHANVTFKDEVQIDNIDGPIIVPEDQPPLKTDKPEKEKRFFFFKKKKKEKDKGRMSPHPGTGVKTPDGEPPAQPWKKPVQGFFSQYVPKTGVQYYRDLAGNIKQGPVGYAPLCQCGPALTRLDHKIDDHKEKVYDYIDASHQVLKGQLDHLDRQTTQQVYAIDKLTKERLGNEHQACHERITQRLYNERRDAKSLMNQYNEQIQTWLETKLSSYGHCLDHHHDDSALPPRNIFSDFHETANGRLFRSRSDETLSQSDYSGKFRKRDFYESRQAAMQQIRGWQIPLSKDASRRRDRGSTTVTHAEVHVRDPERQADGASPVHNTQSPTAQFTPGGGFLDVKSSNTNSNVSRPPGTIPIDIRNVKRDQGAIPKRLPSSQSWQPSSVSQKPMATSQSRVSSPHVRESLSREGSPYGVWTPSKMVRSQTDSSELKNRTSSPKPNLPERGPLNLNNPSSAREFPYRPSHVGTGQSKPAVSPKPCLAYSTPSVNQQHVAVSNSRTYCDQGEYRSYYRDQSSVYPTRTLSSDALLENDGSFSQNLTRSKSTDRTLEDVVGKARPLGRNVNLNAAGGAVANSHAAPQYRHGIPYRIPNTSAASSTNKNPYVSSVLNSIERGNSESVYIRVNHDSANVKENREPVNRSPLDRHQFVNGWKSSDESRERNYGTISPFAKEKQSYRSMYGINGDSYNYKSADNRAGQQFHSKSENNLLEGGLDQSSRNSPCPSHLPSYSYLSNNTSYNKSFTVVSNYSGNITSNSASGKSVTGNSVDNRGNFNSSLNHKDSSSNYGNSFNGVKTSNGYGNDVSNSSSSCLHHESSYTRSSVFNPGYTNTSKENSTCSSNQDSGYSSKAKLPHTDSNQNGLPSNSNTPSSSFSMDRSLTDRSLSVSSPNASHTNSPFSPTSHPDYERVQTRQHQNSVQSHVNSWYQHKLLEAAEKLRNSEQYSSAQNYGDYNPSVIHYDPVNGSDV